MKNGMILSVLLSIFIFGCTSTPKPIVYGSDVCHYCSMTIVDKQHAAQLMTKKGRSYAFDASECMLNHLKEIDYGTVGLFLVNDYEAPGKFVDATQAAFLISADIPSPMGEFLTAFANQEAAEMVASKNSGKLFNWDELRQRFK